MGHRLVLQIFKQFKIGLIASSCFILLNCSDFQEFDGGGTENLTDCELAALDIFINKVSPSIVIDNSTGCSRSNCHNTSHKGLPLSTDNPSSRLALLAYANGSKSRLTSKMYSSSPAHAGGDQSTVLLPEDVDAWWDAESACN